MSGYGHDDAAMPPSLHQSICSKEDSFRSVPCSECSTHHDVRCGFFSFGTPFVMGLLDMGDIIGENSYNHTGAVGLAFWEDNMISWLNVMDPTVICVHL